MPLSQLARLPATSGAMTTADAFLAQKEKFQLGDLPTESPHPKTMQLSDWAKDDVGQGLRVLREVDLDALRRIAEMRHELAPFFHDVAATLESGDRIFLVGCGATGRLSLSLDYLWRRRHPTSDQLRSLMAGGDIALVHSLEGFEDFPDFGARHLVELGFGANDLLIGSTEGGETPYVIGAVEKALAMSHRPPQFLCCNPRQILMDKVERSRRVLTNPHIRSICLDTGPMALTGSTRMQASSVLMLVIGLALDFGRDVDRAFACLERWISFLESQPVTCSSPSSPERRKPISTVSTRSMPATTSPSRSSPTPPSGRRPSTLPPSTIRKIRRPAIR